MKRIKIAVISDLHCHPENFKIKDSDVDDTYLKADMLRTSQLDHPVESLVKLVEATEIESQFILCPGDFTSKSNRQGLISGWNFCLEIGHLMKANYVIGTLGNHDVDSYLSYSNYSLENVKGIKRGFPFKEDETGCLKNFWAVGCGFIEKEEIRILVINSCHFHYNKIKSGSGEVGDDLIDYVDDYLDKVNDDKLSIVLTHHHPIDHSKINLGEQDKILNSDRLLEVLGKHKIDLFIHGHKHHALLRYHPCTESNHQIPIFSSGSFSATSNLSWTQKRNHFHLIEINKEGSNVAKGKVKTWTFFPRQGWILNDDSSGFDVYTGFGYKGEISTLIELVDQKLKENENKDWDELLSEVPDVEYLTPSEMKVLVEGLEARSIIIGRKIEGKPKHIFKPKQN